MTVLNPGSYRSLDPAALPSRDVYKVLTGCIVPRPVALVTSVAPDGTVNAAPFSYFQGVASDPPLLSLALSMRDGGPKDTLANARDHGAFVVNGVTEDMARAMNMTAAELPRHQSEILAAGFHLLPGEAVDVPRIAESPMHLECRLYDVIELGRPDALNALIIGEVVRIHLRADLLDDRLRVDAMAWNPLARLGGPQYATLKGMFEMARPTVAEAEAATEANRGG